MESICVGLNSNTNRTHNRNRFIEEIISQDPSAQGPLVLLKAGVIAAWVLLFCPRRPLPEVAMLVVPEVVAVVAQAC